MTRRCLGRGRRDCPGEFRGVGGVSAVVVEELGAAGQGLVEVDEIVIEGGELGNKVVAGAAEVTDRRRRTAEIFGDRADVGTDPVDGGRESGVGVEVGAYRELVEGFEGGVDDTGGVAEAGEGLVETVEGRGMSSVRAATESSAAAPSPTPVESVVREPRSVSSEPPTVEVTSWATAKD